MATESINPPSPTISRRRPSNRACDRCRRRKGKCDYADSVTCGNCQIVGERCSFDLPVGRRGPKTRRARLSAINPSLNENTTTTSALQFPERSAAIHAAPPPLSPSLETPSLPLTSPATWDQSLTVDPALSPHSTISAPASTRAVSSLQRWRSLSRALRLRDPSSNLERTVNRCFALFFEYLYPLTPLVHEPSLREGLDFFVTQASGINPSTHHADPAIPEVGTAYAPGDHSAEGSILDRINRLEYPELWPDSIFTLITATCAEAAFLLPNDIFPEGETIADIFLQASRNCLNSYLEADLEYPNANSVAIRYFHSNCLHAAGKPKFSWHIFGEATRLAQVMQLHEEASLEGLLPVEAELRRRAFWIVYIGDKSAAILNNRPITIHKFSFESGITTAYPTGIDDELAVSSGTLAPEATRKGFIAGFNANLRLWQAASDLILEMRLLQNQKDATLLGQQLLTAEERNRLDSLYVAFVTCLDDLPPYLQTDAFVASRPEKNPQLKQFIIQRANLQVSLHCLMMVITQKFEDQEFFAPGIEHTEMSLLRKTEIARDMLRVIREAPFWSLQVNGEPCVEKIRLIGASLLAIMHRGETSPLSARARSDFNVLLDFLTRLDSKASDALRSGNTFELSSQSGFPLVQ